MKRKEYKEHKTIICQICHQEIKAPGFPGHIVYSHNITVDKYVEQYGEFRKSKLTEKKNVRNIQQIECQICHRTMSMSGFQSHLLNAHNGMRPEQYREMYGEYRRKYLDYNNRASINQIKCEVCGEMFGSERLLTYHVRMVHNLEKLDYVKQYVFKNVPQLCECGCGREVNYLEQAPYKRKYIKGHKTKI